MNPAGLNPGPEMKCGFTKVRDTDTICEMKCRNIFSLGHVSVSLT